MFRFTLAKSGSLINASLSGCEVFNCKLKKGSPASLRIIFQPDHNVTSGRVNLCFHLNFLGERCSGMPGNYRLLCKNINGSCPVVAGEQYEYTATAKLPNVNYNGPVKVTFKENNGNDFVCVKSTVSLGT
ncbi:unnamed protein product [Dicrocoelium dendriticum]|nr:unnamed protein product [Dicrocoelium dendriticum]